jgi:O-antigen/teichoic acid export membrane protein
MLTFITKLSPQDAAARLRERLQHSPLAHRLARAAAWSLIGAVSSRILTLATSVVVVRLLGKVTVGEFGMVQSTLAMLGTFAGLGLGLTATKYTAELRSRDPDKAGRILAVIIFIAILSGLSMTVAGWAGSDWLADRVLERQSLVPYLRLSSILVLIGVVDGVLGSGLAGFEAFGRIARINIYVAVLNLLITIPLVYWFGLFGAVVGLVVSTGMHLVLAAVALHHACTSYGVVLRLDRAAVHEWPLLVHYALPALAGGILVIPATWLANVILVRTENGFASMGVLKVVDILRNLAMYLPTVLLAPILAVLANVAGDAESVRKTLRYAIGLSALVVLPLALVVTALGKHVLGTLFGADFADEGMTLAFAMIVVAIQATGTALGSYLVATGRMWLGLAINVLWALAFLGLVLAWVPRFGPVGYMGAMAAAYVINVALVYGFFLITSRHLMQSYPLCRVLALFGLLMPMAIYVNQHYTLPIAGGIALLMGFGLAAVLVAPLARLGRVPLPPHAMDASQAMITCEE